MVEICNEVIQSQTMLLPEFRAFFRYEDLYNCKPNLSRKIELYAPIWAIKKQMIKTGIPESYIYK